MVNIHFFFSHMVKIRYYPLLTELATGGVDSGGSGGEEEEEESSSDSSSRCVTDCN